MEGTKGREEREGKASGRSPVSAASLEGWGRASVIPGAPATGTDLLWKDT